mmetsp:Transcript_36779/g.87136  ORF Transcript_36779/g.87136 Transcript_36779/m.87136 type:complete len:240 (-) Transcript_36779:199-918(-)
MRLRGPGPRQVHAHVHRGGHGGGRGEGWVGHPPGSVLAVGAVAVGRDGRGVPPCAVLGAVGRARAPAPQHALHCVRPPPPRGCHRHRPSDGAAALREHPGVGRDPLHDKHRAQPQGRHDWHVVGALYSSLPATLLRGPDAATHDPPRPPLLRLQRRSLVVGAAAVAVPPPVPPRRHLPLPHPDPPRPRQDVHLIEVQLRAVRQDGRAGVPGGVPAHGGGRRGVPHDPGPSLNEFPGKRA